MADTASPVTIILEHLESHESLNAKEARELCGFGMDGDARRVLQELERRQMLKRDYSVRRGPMRFTKGRLFAQWREFQGNGFQTDVLTRGQFEIPGFRRPRMPGMA